MHNIEKGLKNQINFFFLLKQQTKNIVAKDRNHKFQKFTLDGKELPSKPKDRLRFLEDKIQGVKDKVKIMLVSSPYKPRRNFNSFWCRKQQDKNKEKEE